MKKRNLTILASFLIVVAVAGVIAGYASLFNRPLKIDKPTFIYIDNDDNIDSVYHKLQTRLHASSLTGFRLLATYTDYDKHIHTGAYRFNPETQTWNIFRTLQRGSQTPVKLTVPSVRTIGKLCKTVSRQIMADSADIARLLNDSTYCATLGYNAYTLPALFIPNTYEVYWNMDANGFVTRMQKEHKRFWNEKRMNQAKAIGLTPTEVSTLASIRCGRVIHQPPAPRYAAASGPHRQIQPAGLRAAPHSQQTPDNRQPL